LVEIFLPEEENKYGCNNFNPPQSPKSNRIVWLVKRGECTYSKKAFIAQ